jgi:tetratricopeptide (TPR) repeat protein
LVRLRPDKQSRAALAEAYLRAKCYDDAATSYQELTNFEPDNASYHEFLGRALYNLGRNDEAIDACERAATLDPSVGSVRCLLGHAYCRAKRYDEAIKSCCDAVALDKSPYLQKALGDMYYKAERYDEAVAAYEAAVMLEPGVASFWKAIGDAYRATKRHEQAAASYDKQKALEQAESTKMQELPLRLIQGTLEAKRRDSKLVVMREAKRRARRP